GAAGEEVVRLISSAARRNVFGPAAVGVCRHAHDRVPGGADSDLGLRDRRVVRPDHAHEGSVVDHLSDVDYAGVSVVRALATVVKALVRDVEALDPSCCVLLVDGELHAVGGRLAAGRADREVRADIDRPLAPAATATTRVSAGDGDHDRHCEDYESPSSNHMVPSCACWEASANTTPDASHHLPPSSQLESGRECAGGECGHMGWPNCYSEAHY